VLDRSWSHLGNAAGKSLVELVPGSHTLLCAACLSLLGTSAGQEAIKEHFKDMVEVMLKLSGNSADYEAQCLALRVLICLADDTRFVDANKAAAAERASAAHAALETERATAEAAEVTAGLRKRVVATHGGQHEFNPAMDALPAAFKAQLLREDTLPKCIQVRLVLRGPDLRRLTFPLRFSSFSSRPAHHHRAQARHRGHLRPMPSYGAGETPPVHHQGRQRLQPAYVVIGGARSGLSFSASSVSTVSD
jgi:hypothetical protein